MTPTITTDTDVAPDSSTTDLTNCPACGSHVLFTVDLDYGATAGYRPDHFGVEPVQGDTITRCDDCAAFFVHVDGDRVATPAGATAATAAAGDTSSSAAADTNALPDAVKELVEQLFGAALDAADTRIAELEAQLAAAQQPAAVTPDPPAEPAPPATSDTSTSDTSTPPAIDASSGSPVDASTQAVSDTAAVPDPPTPTT